MSRGCTPPPGLIDLSVRGHALEQQAVELLTEDERREIFTRRHLGYGMSSSWARIREIQRPEVRELCRQADAIWWRLAQSHQGMIAGRATFYARKLGCDPAEVLSWAWLGAYAGARRWRPDSGSLYAAIKSWVKNWILVSSNQERCDLSGAGHKRAGTRCTHALRLDQPLRSGDATTLLDVIGAPAHQLDRLMAATMIGDGLKQCSPMQRADLLASADGWEGAELGARRGVSRQTVSDSILEGRRRFVSALREMDR